MKYDLRPFRALLIQSFFLIYFYVGLLAGCTINPIDSRSDQALSATSVKTDGMRDRSDYLQIIQENGGIYRDRNLTEYINAVGERLARVTQHPRLQAHFTLIDNSTPSAAVLPGGYILLTRGLLASLSRESELVYLLGHEFGHLNAGHILSAPAGTTVNISDKGYSLEQEIEADHLAIDYMVRADYAPLAALLPLDVSLQRLNLKMTSDSSAWLLSCFQISVKRLLENQQYINENYPLVVGGDQGNDDFILAFESLQGAENGYITYNQGRQMEHEGQIAEAISAYHQALLEAPNEPVILMGLGMAYLRNEDLIPARRYLLKAINLQGDYYQSHLALGYVYQQKQQYEKALVQFEAGYKLFPTQEGQYLLAETREALGDKEGARKLYKAVIQTDALGKLGRNAAERLKALEE